MNRKKFARDNKFFEIEILMYSEIIPRLQEWKTKQECFRATELPFVKCIHYDLEQGLLVLENVTYQGYRIIQLNEESATVEHCKRYLEHLADVHGLSYLYMQEQGGVEQFRRQHEMLGKVYTDEDGKPTALGKTIADSFSTSAGKSLLPIIKMIPDIEPEQIRRVEKFHENSDNHAQMLMDFGIANTRLLS